MKTFAISPGGDEDLLAWVSVLPDWVTDVVLREPLQSQRTVMGAGRRVNGSGRGLWVHERCAGADQIARALGGGLHLTATGPQTSWSHGRSCHDASELDNAFASGASYAFLSPVFRPTSKPDDRDPLGIELFLAWARERPVAALGGITESRRKELERANAWGVAMLGALQPGFSEVGSKMKSSGS